MSVVNYLKNVHTSGGGGGIAYLVNTTRNLCLGEGVKLYKSLIVPE